LSPRGAGRFPVALVVLLLATVSILPFLRASLLPPAGRAFVGAFYSIPDLYLYFSYMQQAEDGAFLFENKQTLEPHRPAFVNLEWWAVGRLARLTGWTIPVAFSVLGLVAMLALVLGVDQWLRRAGLPATHRLGALLLVFFGAGFGGLLFLAFGPPAWRFLDLTTGLFPVISVMVNAHFVTGTALLVWAILSFNRGGALGIATGLLLGNVLGLSRPYDLVLLVGIRTLTVLLLEPLPRVPQLLLPLLGLFPAVAVNYWMLYGNPAFRMISGYKYSVPPYLSIGLALAPALVLAALGLRSVAKAEGEERLYRTSLLAWAGMALFSTAVLSIPFSFLFQSCVNIGVPLFGLAALGLAHRPPRMLVLAALLSSTTGLVALKILLDDNPSWFVPRVRLAAARALGPLCRRGDVALAPAEIGVYLNAWSSCRAFVTTQVVAPDKEERLEELTFFYMRARGDERRALLDRRCVTHVILPAASEGPAEQGLGPGFRRAVRVDEKGALDIFVRERPPACGAGVRQGSQETPTNGMATAVSSFPLQMPLAPAAKTTP
jgi:hypothetical protein